MSGAYAQKLRYWLVSMMSLILAMLLSISSGGEWNLVCQDLGSAICIANALPILIFGFIPVALWHLLDAFDVASARRWWSSYGMFLPTLLVVELIFVLATSGLISRTTLCGSGLVMLSQSCYGPHPIVLLAEYCCALLLVTLVLLKAVATARSVVRARR